MNGRRRRKRRRTYKEIYRLIIFRTPRYPNVNDSHYIFYNLKQSKYLCTVVYVHLFPLLFSNHRRCSSRFFLFYAYSPPIFSYPLFLSFSYSYLRALRLSLLSDLMAGSVITYADVRQIGETAWLSALHRKREREIQRERHETLGEWRIQIDRMVRERLSTRVYKRGRAAIGAYDGIHCQLAGCLQSIDYYHSNRPVTTRRDTAPGQWTNTKTRVDPPTFVAILRKINTSRRISAKLSSTSTGNCSIVLWLDPREGARRDGFRAIQTKVDMRDVMLYAASNLGALERFLRRMYLVLHSFFILWCLEVERCFVEYRRAQVVVLVFEILRDIFPVLFW